MSAAAIRHVERDVLPTDKSTFGPALRLLPTGVREDVERLYLVLRTLDDLVDEDDPRAVERVGAVERWAEGNTGEPPAERGTGEQLAERRTDGQPAGTPETRTLDELARRHPLLPRDRLLEFCQGMRHDIARASIYTEQDFERYCQQAGGSVGIVLANLLGTPGGAGEAETQREAETWPEAEAQAGPAARPAPGARQECEAKMATLGRAMQVTNILRDIDEDRAHGRLYIPRTLIERFGFPEPGAREPLLRELIARADALYEEGGGAIPLLRGGRAAMALSAALYREILRQIERDGFGRRPGRAVVPAWRRQQLIARHRRADVSDWLTA